MSHTITIAQAIEELEDRGVPEIIKLLRSLGQEIVIKDAAIARLQAEVDDLKYGEF